MAVTCLTLFGVWRIDNVYHSDVNITICCARSKNSRSALKNLSLYTDARQKRAIEMLNACDPRRTSCRHHGKSS